MEAPQVSIKVRNFKCFGTELQGFDEFKSFNVIIGRNNSGKSSLLDLFPLLITGKYEFTTNLYHAGQSPELIASGAVTEEIARRVFRDNTSGGAIPGNHWQFGVQIVGSQITYRINDTNNPFVDIGPSPSGSNPFERLRDSEGLKKNLANAMPRPFNGLQFCRIAAERDIVPEQDSGASFDVLGNGSGVTDAIQGYINKANLPSELVESELLQHLNQVFDPDAHFTDIVCQQLGTGEWEIYLQEESKGRIPLSQSGSGLKTVIIVLVHIVLGPHIYNKDLDQFVFGFEELENNLHPALLRRFLNYLFSLSMDDGPLMFLTTHSNVAIDFFGKDENAQLVHVTHDGTVATCRTATTYIDNNGILDDLDVRASELLQSNCIIWVEGPSDRIYVNRWISLASDDELREGLHYQCVFYGGRLLSHLTASEPDSTHGIEILRANRRAIIIIDSDKRAQQSRINDTKKRIVEEIESSDGIAWVTKGREIENYISSIDINAILNRTDAPQVDQYAAFSDYLDGLDDGEGKRFLRQKPLFAERIVPSMTANDSLDILDLRSQLTSICDRIKQWNDSKVA
ncbi:ATP-dependent nuclease [Adhaeretor mobilis]|uniref:ATPase AAA-type core domain-containing protein n=1 Tax=Adhaeretor mobilis TaxID=1930276 RepID=A0A517MRV3_9BACT|nr:AAA family ATPase [Adhaeretor mobilis]QDS97611.1 hypothetical protein HG15A2_08740 [Adhaeretor mobilis]